MESTKSIYLEESFLARLESQESNMILMTINNLKFNKIMYKSQDFKKIEKEASENPNIYIIGDRINLIEYVQNFHYFVNSQFILYTHSKDEENISSYTQYLKGLNYSLGSSSINLIPFYLHAVLSSKKPYEPITERIRQTRLLESMQIELKHSNERIKSQELVQKFFTKHIKDNKVNLAPGAESFARHMADVLDEFLMNAIWDANPGRVNTDRAIAVNLEKKESVKINCYCDETNLYLSVVDNFGMFPQKAIVKPMRYALGIREEKKINEGLGGAGLGLYMVLQKIGSLLVEVNKNQSTIVTAIIRGDQSFRETQKLPRTVLFLEK